MDGTRTRLVALTVPLALAVVLGIAALASTPPHGRPTEPGSDPSWTAPATTRGTLETASAVFGLPKTTPPPSTAQEARTASAPQPVPVQPAGTR